ncbi:hypothetical protein BH10ACT9_BH10ACT9_30210 [soil metagenome]
MKTLGLLRLAAGVSSFDRFVTPALLLSMAADLEVSLGIMSSAATLYFVLYATLQPVWAVVSDYVGRLAVIRLALLAASVAALVVGLALLRARSSAAVEREPFGPALRYCLRRPQALLIIGLAFVEGGVVHGTLTYWPAALEHVGSGPALAGLSVACFGLGVILGSRWVSATTLSRHRIMVVGGATIAVALAVTGATQASGIGLMLGLAAVLGLGFSALHSSLQGVATEVVPRARSVVIALFAAALFTGGAAGTALASSIASVGHFDLIFVVAAVITVPLTLACLATKQPQ